MNVQEVFIGGWFQRTSLHLREIHDFLKFGESRLALSANRLKELHNGLNISSVHFVMDELDYVSCVISDEISVRIYEDGLTTLSMSGAEEGLTQQFEKLTHTYEEKISPAFSYIFSLGAPVPKELAHIKAIYPYFVVLENGTKQDVADILEMFDQDEISVVSKQDFELTQGSEVQVFNNKGTEIQTIRNFFEETIFLREFQAQLERYLNIHRNIWEKIAEIKERGSVRGNKIGEYRAMAESYAKTINLIETRIAQMDTYIHTRERITSSQVTNRQFKEILEYRYETLSDSLAYVSELWVMTKNYVHQALELFSSIQAKSTQNSIKSLTLVTTVGALAGLLRLTFTDVSKISTGGIAYFIGLIIVAWLVGIGLNRFSQNKEYKIKSIETARDV